MPTKLTREAINQAIDHLVKYGDTDLLPHLPEITFLEEKKKEVVECLVDFDLENYEPASPLECLAPKNRHAFRIAHQLTATDSLLFLAAAIEVGSNIEQRREPIENLSAFSYRFEIGDNGSIFNPSFTYKDWLHRQTDLLNSSPDIQYVIKTDIADYYGRILFHRLESLLDLCDANPGVVRFIKRFIKRIRAKQSFGLPVGGSAARLLAELAIADTDRALREEGFVSTRFVDDFRILIGTDQDPYDALAFLAEHLAINEGLFLNAAKTKILNRRKFMEELSLMRTDVFSQAEESALEILAESIYVEEEPDEDALRELSSFNLLQMLDEELAAEIWDVGQIKRLFRAIRLTLPEQSIDYIKNNFDELVPFMKDVALYMHEAKRKIDADFSDLSDVVVNHILNSSASKIQLTRAWLMETIVRGNVPISLADLRKLETLNSTLDKRQLLLIRGRLERDAYFRKKKTALNELSPWEQPMLLWGASCLPPDEFSVWISNVKPMMEPPLGKLYAQWIGSKGKDLLQLLDA